MEVHLFKKKFWKQKKVDTESTQACWFDIRFILSNKWSSTTCQRSELKKNSEMLSNRYRFLDCTPENSLCMVSSTWLVSLQQSVWSVSSTIEWHICLMIHLTSHDYNLCYDASNNTQNMTHTSLMKTQTLVSYTCYVGLSAVALSMHGIAHLGRTLLSRDTTWIKTLNLRHS